MPLTLTVPVGASISVGDSIIQVVRSFGLTNFLVTFLGKEYTVTDHDWTALADGVKVRAPFPRHRRGRQSQVRIQIEAPGIYVSRL